MFDKGFGKSLKHFTYWAGGAALAVMVSIGAHNWMIAAVYVVVTVVLYLLDCVRSPMRDCWTCKGRGNNKSWIRSDGTGQCRACGRSGRQRRAGSIVMGLKPN